MKPFEILMFVVFALVAIPFFIAFSYMLRAQFYLFKRVASGEIGWNPFGWNRALSHDSYFVEMFKGARRWLLIYIAEVAVFMLIFAIVAGILVLLGVVKVTPTAKPTPQNTSRVLAAPRNRGNAEMRAVLK